MSAFGTVIRLKWSGRLAVFADDGHLAGWTDDVAGATVFPSDEDAAAAIRGICAPEIRAAIRAGHAAIVHAVDEDGEETGEVHIVDAHDRLELYPTPRIRPDVGPRYLDDDPLKNAAERDNGAASRARTLVQELFREAPRLNWKIQTMPRITPAKGVAEEYTMPMSARARRAAAYGGYGRAA